MKGYLVLLLIVFCLTTNVSSQVQFMPHIVANDAWGAYSVYAIDVDSDGDIDVLSASENDDKIAWYENDGNENFTTHIITTDADGAYSVYAIDIDDDGDIDVLSASVYDDKIAWYENNGSENFTTHIIILNEDYASSVYAEDVDGDGDMDVLSAAANTNRIVWYENDGTENFTPHTITSNAMSARSVYAIDVDGDDDIDVLSASVNDNKIAWYENDGSENFTPHSITTNANGANSVYAIDVNNDGEMDVLSASWNDNKIAWYENDGSENFTSHTISDSATVATSVYAVDVDGDSDIDVLSASRQNSEIVWYENDDSENFTSHTISDSATVATSVYAVDVDGDGDIDVLSASSSRVTWYENLGPIYISVTSPNGGEVWKIGEQYNITWNSQDVTNVKIEYSTNSGVSWITIINSTSSSGSYSWTIPNTPSINCKVKISDVAYPFIYDESDNVFSIIQPVTVTSPNGGEVWIVGEQYDITWNSQDVTNVKIEYSTNSGVSWITIINSTSSSGSYSWTIPNTPSANCKVKISDVTNPLIYDESDNVFSIIQSSVIVTSPNGGETFEGTTTEIISFTSIAVDSVMIHYSSNAGNTWVLIKSSVPAAGYVDWIVPNISSENCLIKLTDTQDSNTFDISDSVFIIMEVGWYKQNSNVSNRLTSIDMWNSLVGYSCGLYGTIVRTTDGGSTWESLSTGIIEDLFAIDFVNENTGWVVGSDGKILKTTNGGLSWSYQISNTTKTLNSVYFINENVGWAVGWDGTILKTTDSGNNWVTQQSSIAVNLNSVFFYSSNLGWIVGNLGAYVKTTNGGSTWIQKTTGTTNDLNSISFATSETGNIVGDNGTILHSIDEGEIWTNVSNSFGHYYSISFPSAETGYIVGGSGLIYKSTDSGLNWFRIASGLQSYNTLYDVTFIDINTGWAVGQNGNIIKTITGGSGYVVTNLIANAMASSQILEVSNIEGFSVDDNILINPGGTNQEINKIVGFGSILLESPLQYDHQIGELVTNLKPTVVEEEIIDKLPHEYRLHNNYPNPFNPSTKIRYSVPQLSNVMIKVFDILGNEIETLVNEEKSVGIYEIIWYAENLPSGIYFYRLQSGSFVETKKMLLLK